MAFSRQQITMALALRCFTPSDLTFSDRSNELVRQQAWECVPSDHRHEKDHVTFGWFPLVTSGYVRFGRTL